MEGSILFSRKAHAIFMVAAIVSCTSIIISTTIYIAIAVTLLPSVDTSRTLYTVCFVNGIIAGPLSAILWFGMISFWWHHDNSPLENRHLWIVALIAIPPSVIGYFFFVYRKQIFS